MLSITDRDVAALIWMIPHMLTKVPFRTGVININISFLVLIIYFRDTLFILEKLIKPSDVSFSEWNYVASVAVYDYSRERFSLLRSFEGWPQYLSLSPQLLADNGYFFTGVRDFISCCQCGTVRHPSEEGIEEFKKNLHCIRCIADNREAQRSSNLENQRQRKVNIGTSVLENQIVASTSKYKTHSSQNTFQQSDFVTMSQIGESLSPEYAAALSSHISDFTVPSTAVFSPHTSSAMSIQNINIPAFPNYVRKSERLKSFHQWPISHIAHPADLANAGFFYEGYPDVVRCFWCGLQHQSWRMGDDPKAIHANLRPECPCLHKDPASANDSAKDLAIRFMER